MTRLEQRERQAAREAGAKAHRAAAQLAQAEVALVAAQTAVKAERETSNTKIRELNDRLQAAEQEREEALRLVTEERAKVSELRDEIERIKRGNQPTTNPVRQP